MESNSISAPCASVLKPIYTIFTPETWGRFPINETLLENIYFNALKDPKFDKILKMTTEVNDVQRFNVPSGVAMKAGWDLQHSKESPHLITNIIIIENSEINAKVSSVKINSALESRWIETLKQEGPNGALKIHEKYLK